MAKISLSGMTVEALMDLRERVDEMLHERRAEIEKQLKMFAVVGGRRVVRGSGSALKGKKSRPNIAVLPARLGQAVAQGQGGLLLRSKVARNSTISSSTSQHERDGKSTDRNAELRTPSQYRPYLTPGPLC